MSPSNSLANRPYPSEPTRRYRQSRVGNRQQGTTQNQVWTVTLNATGGSWLCTVNDAQGRKVSPLGVIANFGSFTCNPTATAAVMQAMFEAQVGVGNVGVTGGPGASGGGTPYVISFLGELAGQRLFLSSDVAFMTGGGLTQTLVETTEGGTPNAAVPNGPSLSTNTPVPTNGPVAREA